MRGVLICLPIPNWDVCTVRNKGMQDACSRAAADKVNAVKHLRSGFLEQFVDRKLLVLTMTQPCWLDQATLHARAIQ
jgi:hypothetical protein